MSDLIGDAVVRVRADASGFAKNAQSSVKSQVGSLVKIASGALAIGGAGDFLKDAVSNAVTFQEQIAGLDTTLANVGQGTDKARKTADNYAEALSKMSGFARVDVAESLQKATQGTGNLGKAMQVETTAANLARARHIDLSQATLLVTKAFDGNTSSLKRLGISFSPVTKAQDALAQKIAAAKKATDSATGSTKKQDEAYVKVLQSQVKAAKATDLASTSLSVQKKLTDLVSGGMKTFAGTTAGQLAKVRNSVDEVQTKIGLALLPVIGKLASGAAKYIDELDEKWPEISKSVSDTVDRIRADLKPFTDALLDLQGPIESVVNYLGGAKKVLELLGAGIVAFVVVSKTIEVATAIYEGLSAAIFLVRNAQVALDVAMEANPIGIVVGALVLLGAALYEAYQHSATFRAIVNKAFADVKAAAQTSIGYITTVILPDLRKAWDTIEPPLATAATAIIGTITRLVDEIRSHWNEIKSIFAPVVETAIGAVVIYVQGLAAEFGHLIDLIGDAIHGRWSNVWDDLKGLVTTPINSAKAQVVNLITGMGPALLTAGKAAAARAVAGIKAGLNAIPGLAGALAGYVGSMISAAAKGVFNEAKRIGSLVVDGIKQGIEDGAGDLAGAAKSVAKKALSGVTGGLLDAVQTGGSIIGQIEAGIKRFGPQLTKSLVDQVTAAVTQAKQNLSSQTSGLAGDLGTFQDAALAKLNAPLQATIDKDQADRQQRQLQDALTSAKAAAAAGPTGTNADGSPLTPAQVADQQAALNQAVLDAQTDLDDAKLQAQIQQNTNAEAIAKQGVANQIALWTQQYNQGLISAQTFYSDLASTVVAVGAPGGTLNDAYANFGDALGAAWETSFSTHLSDIQTQIQDIAAAGPPGIGGSGIGGTITNPADVISSQFATAFGTSATDSAAVTKAAQALAAAQKKVNAASHDVIGPNGQVYQTGDPKAIAAADKAFEAASAQLDAAKASQAKDDAMTAALRAILVKLGVDPNQVIADATR